MNKKKIKTADKMTSNSMEKATRADLKSEVWRAANIMRSDDGTNGVIEYIEQISWMFFLKVFEDLEERFETNYKLKNKKYSRIIPKKYSWSKWSTEDSRTIIDFIDNELFPNLSKLSGTPEKKIIAQIFDKIKRNKMESASNLKDIIDILNNADFNNPDDSHTLSQFYEDLLLKLGKESGVAGEFYTPRPIVKLMIKIIDPKPKTPEGNLVKLLDPFCGSCGFLAESFKHMLQSKKIHENELEKFQRQVFYGQEKKSLPFLVGMMNCILHGLFAPNVIRKNTLNQNILNFDLDEKFDYVFTNPPFGGKEGKGIQNNFPVKIMKTELLALQHIMRRLNDRGECAVVLPEPIFWRLKKYLTVRKDLIDNFNVHTIISLPAGVFANVTPSGLGPKTNLIFFNRKGVTKEIWYYELTPLKKRAYSRVNIVKDEDLIDCFTKFKKREISKNSWIVKREEIDDDCDLTASNPNLELGFKTVEPEKAISEVLTVGKKISTIIQNLTKTFDNSERKKINFDDWEVIPLRECILDENGYQSGFACAKRYEVENGIPHLRPFNVSIHGILDLETIVYLPGNKVDTNTYGLKKGDVIFNNTNSKELVGKSAIVEEDITCGFSNHLTRLRVKKEKLSPEWLVLILRYNWLSSLFLKKSRKWIGQAGMNEDNILDTEIIIPDPDIQSIIIDEYVKSRDKFEEIDELMSQFQDGFQNLRVSTLKYLIKNKA